MENRPLTALIERLAVERRVWVRVVASRPQTEWQLSLLEVTLGAPPQSWRRRRWRYPRALFLASAPSGGTVGEWLARGRIPLRPPSLAIRPRDRAHVERRESRFAGVLEALDWPSIVWTVGVDDESTQVLHDELVATDSPAFLNFDEAAAAFLGLLPALNRTFSGREIIVREQDRRARIEAVRVRPTGVLVAVGGEALEGTSVTLGGEAGPSERLPRGTGTREVRLPLGSSLASGAWLALHGGQELLDRRILDPSWRQPNVEVEVEALTRVEVLISGGEGPSTEFKRELPGSDPRGAMKTVSAFANGAGGSLIFGVDDDGQVVGLGDENCRRAVDRLTSLITDWVQPRVHFTPELVDVRGVRVLLVEVTAGDDAPYGVGTSDREVVYYVRRGATSFPASPADIRAFVRARMPVSAVQHPILRR